MNRNRVIAAIALVVATMGTAGCWFAGGPKEVRRDVADAADVRLEREFGLRLGRVGLFLARTGLRIAQEPDISLEGVRKVEVGVYEARPRRNPSRRAESLSLCRTALSDWELVVRVCEDGEHVLMYVDEQDDEIHGFLVVAQEEEEVVIVRARGRLDPLVESVLELAREEGELDENFPWSRRRGQARDAAGEPEPWVAVCETGAGVPDDADCVAPDEARDRVLGVARMVVQG